MSRNTNKEKEVLQNGGVELDDNELDDVSGGEARDNDFGNAKAQCENHDWFFDQTDRVMKCRNCGAVQGGISTGSTWITA